MKRINAAVLGAGVGAGVGAGLMYFLDPDRGKRRRALVRDKAVHVAHECRDSLDVATRGLANRAQGLYAKTRSWFECGAIADPVLRDRVRSRIGHVVSHPASIEVEVEDGKVRLAGPILTGELSGLLHCVSRVRGVAAVENRLEVHEAPDGAPGRQGSHPAVQ